MTNFSNYLMKTYNHVQNYGSGYERWNLAAKMYGESTGYEGAKAMAKATFYSHSYTMPYTQPDYWWTDMVDEESSAPLLMSWTDSSKHTGALWEEFLDYYQYAQKAYDWRKRGYDSDHQLDFWYTSHSSIWDLEEKTLVLDIEEQDLFQIKINF